MKTVISFIVLCLIVSSCDNVLNIEPKSIVTNVNMWEDESDAKGAMNGMYRQFRQAMNQTFLWGDARTGFYTRGVSIRNPELFENRVNPGSNGSNWNNLYTTINDANLILKHVPTIQFSNESQKNNILANAHFVRAVCYYNIGRIWGDAPLLLDGFESATQEGLYPTRTPVAEIFNQVNNDIETALNLVPANANNIIYASESAINMLKADLHLWLAKARNGGTENLNIALSAVNKVLQGNYSLLNNYETVFRNDTNSETIYSIRFERDQGPGNYYTGNFLLPVQRVPANLRYNPIPHGGPAQWYSMTQAAENFLHENPNDSRSMINFAVYRFGNVNYKFVNKYIGEFIDGTFYPTSDLKLYRFAEAIMYKAEIENALGNQAVALDYLNLITARAYGQANFYSGIYSREELDELILNERIKEFSSEGKVWFDLIRFGRVFERVWSLQGKENEVGILLWPLNFDTMNRNPNLVQNLGY
jgi:starch-binding outer membrane protein, SusD/RagB family